MLIDPTVRRAPAPSRPTLTGTVMPWSIAKNLITFKARGLAPADADQVLVVQSGSAYVATLIVDGV